MNSQFNNLRHLLKQKYKFFGKKLFSVGETDVDTMEGIK